MQQLQQTNKLTPTGSRWVCSCLARSLLLLKALLQLLCAANLHRNGFSPVCDLGNIGNVSEDFKMKLFISVGEFFVTTLWC